MKIKNETRRFLWDIRYDTGKSDKNSKSLRIIKQIFDARRRKIYARGLSQVNPNNLIERLQLLILAKKLFLLVYIMNF